MPRTVTARLFAEDLHRQHLDVGELRFRAAVPQPTAERQYRASVIDQQRPQDQRSFQAHGRLPKTPGTDFGYASSAPRNLRIGYYAIILQLIENQPVSNQHFSI